MKRIALAIFLLVPTVGHGATITDLSEGTWASESAKIDTNFTNVNADLTTLFGKAISTVTLNGTTLTVTLDDATEKTVSLATFLTSESDPTVNALGSATLTCSTDQFAKYNGSAWVCADGSTSVDLGAPGTIGGDTPGNATFVNLTVTGDAILPASVVFSEAIVGWMNYGADITASTAHDTTEVRNAVYHFTSAATVTLDAAEDAKYGATVSYRIRDASEAAVIDPQAGEKINLNGTALAAGVGITATGAGKFVTLVSTTDTDGSGTDGWEVWGNNGFASE